MELAAQRIADPMLRKIEKQIAQLLKAVGVKRKVRPVAFGTNYFELPVDWFALCYSYHYHGEPIPLNYLRSRQEIPGDLVASSQEPIFREPEAFSAQVITRPGGAAKPAVFLAG